MRTRIASADTVALLLASPLAAVLAVVAPSISSRAPVRTLAITANEYGFTAPDTVVAGRTAIQLTNRGGELHHAYLVRLEAGHTAAGYLDALKAGGPPPAWAHDAGGPNTPVPGASTTTVVDLKPGAYVLLCVIPSADGAPHVMKGMFRALTVVAEKEAKRESAQARGAEIPAADVTMELNDYGFDLSRPLAAGRHVVRVTNVAAQSHEVVIARLAPGKSAQDLLAWIGTPSGPPPAVLLGGTAALAKAEWNDVVLDLAAGEYALLCFVPDARDGAPHVAHGMMRQITVR